MIITLVHVLYSKNVYGGLNTRVVSLSRGLNSRALHYGGLKTRVVSLSSGLNSRALPILSTAIKHMYPMCMYVLSVSITSQIPIDTPCIIILIPNISKEYCCN